MVVDLKKEEDARTRCYFQRCLDQSVCQGPAKKRENRPIKMKIKKIQQIATGVNTKRRAKSKRGGWWCVSERLLE